MNPYHYIKVSKKTYYCDVLAPYTYFVFRSKVTVCAVTPKDFFAIVAMGFILQNMFLHCM